MELHEKFKLQPETLHLTVHILDRFLSVELVTKKKLQLLGVASLMIACKYEEIYPPDLQDFLYVTKNSYSQEEILKQERKVLNTLKWRLTQPYSILYLAKFCSIFNFEKRQQHLIEYMLDLSLLDYHMIKYSPSILASSAIQLTLSLFKQPWPGIFQQLTDYTSQNLEECTLDLQALCQKAQLDQTFYKQIKKKYSQNDFSNVSRIQIGSNNSLESPPRHIKSNSQESQGLEQLTKKIQGISIAKSSNT